MKFIALSLLITLNGFAHGQIKIYVLDGGILEGVNPERFGLKNDEVTTTRLPVPCFLIVHPKGTLMWDGGAVPDSVWQYNGSPASYTVEYKDIKRDVSLSKPLKAQLEDDWIYSSGDDHLSCCPTIIMIDTGNAMIQADMAGKRKTNMCYLFSDPEVTWPATYSSKKFY